MSGKLMLSGILLALAAGTTQNLFAASSTVGLCAGPGPHYTTITAAVAAATPGTVIDVCPGTYPEQITITKALTLQGIRSGVNDAAIIVSPSGGVAANTTETDGFPTAAQIVVDTAPGLVTISYLTVDGSNNKLSGCGTDLVGIYYKNSAGSINNNAVRNQALDTADFGCQDGLGIFVESNIGSPVTIANNSVRNYDKNGITVDGPGNGNPGPAVTVRGNTVIGVGATSLIAQNGIQVSDGATGTVANNDVADDIYTGPSAAASTGILIYASSGVTVSANTIQSTQYAVSTDSDPNDGLADHTTVIGNRIGGTVTFDAIDLCSNHNSAKSNVIYGSGESAIHLDDLCKGPGDAATGTGNTVQSNSINEACAGVLLGSSAPGTVGANSFTNVVYTLLAGDTCSPPMATLKTQESSQRQSRRPSPFNARRN